MATPTFPGLLVPESESLVTPVAPEVQRAVCRFEFCRDRVAGLLAACDFDALADAQDEMAMRRQQLAEAGRLDLIGADR
jgi:hypothetical protein